MFKVFHDIPTTTSLLMQCGYRSKVCTNIRATKLDGTLHRLCEFHRRKANMSQWRLHKRQREERVKRRRGEASAGHPAKRSRPRAQESVSTIDPIPFDVVAEATRGTSGQFASSSITPEDLEILELLLPVDPLEMPPTCSQTAANCIVV